MPQTIIDLTKIPQDKLIAALQAQGLAIVTLRADDVAEHILAGWNKHRHGADRIEMLDNLRDSVREALVNFEVTAEGCSCTDPGIKKNIGD